MVDGYALPLLKKVLYNYPNNLINFYDFNTPTGVVRYPTTYIYHPIFGPMLREYNPGLVGMGYGNTAYGVIGYGV